MQIGYSFGTNCRFSFSFQIYLFIQKFSNIIRVAEAEVEVEAILITPLPLPVKKKLFYIRG